MHLQTFSDSEYSDVLSVICLSHPSRLCSGLCADRTDTSSLPLHLGNPATSAHSVRIPLKSALQEWRASYCPSGCRMPPKYNSSHHKNTSPAHFPNSDAALHALPPPEPYILSVLPHTFLYAPAVPPDPSSDKDPVSELPHLRLRGPHTGRSLGFPCTECTTPLRAPQLWNRSGEV